MGFWAGFAKYVGIQGVLALGLGAGFIAAPFVGVTLPDGYTELNALVIGFYFAKNGVNVTRRITGQG